MEINHNHKQRLSSKLVATKYPIMATNSIYSSLLGNVKHIIYGLFPPRFFKYTYIKNSVASVTEHHLTDDDKVIKEIPALSINMNYEPQDSTFAGDPFIHANMMTFNQSWDRGLYDPILRNFNERVFISSMIQRMTHTFEVGIHLNTAIQAVNIMGYLHSKIGGLNGKERKMFYNNYYIDVPLPMTLIGALAAAKDMQVKSKEDFIKLGEYLYEMSRGSIIYKKHSASGKYLFFYTYPVNLLVSYGSIGAPEENKEGKTMLSSSIKLEMKVEYNSFNIFILESYQNLDPIDLSEYMIDTEVGVTLHYALRFPYTEQIADGRRCVFREEFITDSSRADNNLDETEFGDVLNPHVRDYINKLKEEEKDDKLYTILLYDGYELNKGIDYEVDWKNFILKIKEPHLNVDYRLYIYADEGEIIDNAKARRETYKNKVIITKD